MFHKPLLLIVFFLAIILRTIWISDFPVGFTQDEAAIGYDAYSILLTGKDMWGERLPLILRSFGDFKFPLYSYLTIPFIANLGLNETAVRLPSALFGALAVLAVYFMVKVVSGNKDIALISSALLAFSPWHISLSRGAFESNLTTFFVPIGVGCFILGIKKPKYMVLSAIAFGLNLFTYHSARYFIIIFLPILLYLYRSNFTFSSKAELFAKLRKYIPAIIVFTAFLLLVAISMISGGQNRAYDIAIFNPTDKWSHVADRRYEAVLQEVPDSISRVFSNKATYVTTTLAKNYISYLSASFFFVHGAGEWGYGMVSGRGLLYYFEFITLVLGVGVLFTGKKLTKLKFLLIWVLIAAIPASLTKGPGFAANRAAVMMPAVQVISAVGVYALFIWVKNNYSKRTLHLVRLGFIVILLLSLFGFLEDYLYHAPMRAAGAMQYGRKEAVEFIKTQENNYDEIFISRSLSVPHIWVLFYHKYDPYTVQEESKNWLRYEEEGLVSVDQLDSYNLGKYTFGSIKGDEGPNTLFAGRPGERRSKHTLLKEIRYKNSLPEIVVFENEKQ
jgi:4-amino-4-deoxy-L-arabinose transferase-like glycosyltransferase